MKDMRNPFDDSVYTTRSKQIREDVRGPYLRDQFAIINSLPFRRMKHKAQVFFDPKNDHVCTRMEHTLLVANTAMTIASKLGFNPELAYAIGLGHDLGHAPFGHAGEKILNSCTKDIGGFIHEMHGLRIVDFLGNRGEPLNLTFGVRDGIICHCGEKLYQELEPRKDKIDINKITSRNTIPSTYEGCIARMADRISFLGRDLEDALYGQFVNEADIPKIIQKELGETNGTIIDTLIIDIINTTKENGIISFSDHKFNLINELYKFSVDKIYNHPAIIRYIKHCERIIQQLFDYLMARMGVWAWNQKKYSKSPVPLDRRFGRYLKNMKKVYSSDDSNMAVVRDYISGMTDSYALRCMKEISFPESLDFDID